MTDLTPAIDFSQSEVLNGKIENLQDIFTDGEGLLISEDDAQMIIKLTFKEIVKMKTFKIVSLEDGIFSCTSKENYNDCFFRCWT